MTWCKNPDRGLPDPDLIFYLDISTKDAQTRGSYGEERYEKAEFQERVAEIYEQLKSNDWKVNTTELWFHGWFRFCKNKTKELYFPNT